MLLLQEFNLEIRDKKGSENLVADHLSRLEQRERGDNVMVSITEEFPNEKLLALQTCDAPWYADFVNYLVSAVVPSNLSYQQKKKFFSDVKYYLWEDLFLYKYCSNQIIGRRVLEEEMRSILQHCHFREVGGHFGAIKTTAKVLQSSFYWPTLFKDAYIFVAACDRCQRTGNISKKNEMPLTNILELELFDVWRIDFIGLFSSSFKNKYILVAVDYVSKLFEAVALPCNDARVVVSFLKKNIFTRFGTPRAIL